MQSEPYAGFAAYALRPELAESLYYLHRTTRNPLWLHYGREMVSSLQALCRVDCGYSALADIKTHERRDWMDSFFLSETLKYLFLLFDAADSDRSATASHHAGGRHGRLVFDPEDVVFTTEAHPISRRRLQAMQVPGDYFGSPPVAAAAGHPSATAGRTPSEGHSNSRAAVRACVLRY